MSGEQEFVFTDQSNVSVHHKAIMRSYGGTLSLEFPNGRELYIEAYFGNIVVRLYEDRLNDEEPLILREFSILPADSDTVKFVDRRDERSNRELVVELFCQNGQLIMSSYNDHDDYHFWIGSEEWNVTDVPCGRKVERL